MEREVASPRGSGVVAVVEGGGDDTLCCCRGETTGGL